MILKDKSSKDHHTNSESIEYASDLDDFIVDVRNYDDHYSQGVDDDSYRD